MSIVAITFSVTIMRAADIGAGKTAYDTSCKSCHGADGTANPAIAKMMKVDMQDLKSPAVRAMSDADIKAVIANGKGKMHAVGSVSGTSADDVVSYVRSLKK